MPTPIRINDKQTVRFRDYTLLFDLILVTKSEKWYRPAHVETLLSYKDTHSYAAFLIAYDTKSDEMSYTEKIRYDFSDTFNLEKNPIYKPRRQPLWHNRHPPQLSPHGLRTKSRGIPAHVQLCHRQDRQRQRTPNRTQKRRS